MKRIFKNHRKTKGFTFAELMISLVVIAVLGAILYPTIAQFTPNSNKPLFKSAYRTLSSVIYELVNERESGILDTTDTTGTILCQAFCKRANVLPEKNGVSVINTCTGAGTNLCTDNIVTTPNGMRWRFEGYDNYNDPNPQNSCGEDVQINNVFRIFVDVNASNNDLEPRSNGNEFPTKLFDPASEAAADKQKGVFYYNKDATAQGIFTTCPDITTTPITTAVYNSDHLKTQDTFEILMDAKGKIVSMSPAAWANLEDNLNTLE